MVGIVVLVVGGLALVVGGLVDGQLDRKAVESTPT
jgi:hypothetical protein